MSATQTVEQLRSLDHTFFPKEASVIENNLHLLFKREPRVIIIPSIGLKHDPALSDARGSEAFVRPGEHTLYLTPIITDILLQIENNTELSDTVYLQLGYRCEKFLENHTELTPKQLGIIKEITVLAQHSVPSEKNTSFTLMRGMLINKLDSIDSEDQLLTIFMSETFMGIFRNNPEMMKIMLHKISLDSIHEGGHEWLEQFRDQDANLSDAEIAQINRILGADKIEEFPQPLENQISDSQSYMDELRTVAYRRLRQFAERIHDPQLRYKFVASSLWNGLSEDATRAIANIYGEKDSNNYTRASFHHYASNLHTVPYRGNGDQGILFFERILAKKGLEGLKTTILQIKDELNDYAKLCSLDWPELVRS